eukprot:TRINITY_DN18321_c0_g1_i1.p1 TRINITY_DN18321_c0_g1~~TRINITY_DN18321_c0_g1_i1.p1  ORF type:complete len:180 (+),score=34.61 TRINITY_DN18321_c0_g1_i1:138-677(+)
MLFRRAEVRRPFRYALCSSSPVTGNPALHVRTGQIVTLQRTFTAKDVETFGHLVGDDNPVHTSGDLHDLQKGRPIVHGILVASLISATFGTKFPGTVYLNQELRFKSPVFIDDNLEARVTFLSLRKSAKLQALIATCTTEVFKLAPETEISSMTHEEQEEELVVDGRASVLLPKEYQSV